MTLMLSDIIEKVGLKTSQVRLIRHALSNTECEECYRRGHLDAYTRTQSPKQVTGAEYWITFIGESKDTTRLDACYRVRGHKQVTLKDMPKGYPYPDHFVTSLLFDLERINHLKDYEQRLIINWGDGIRSWSQRGEMSEQKEVLAIERQPRKPFPDFENVVIDYATLSAVVNNREVYEIWQEALSSIAAIYLITDLSTGKLYVGSACGGSGLLGRWSEYVETTHGGNIGIINHLKQYPKAYQHFQFSILQILPKSITCAEAVVVENLYKRKLGTREFGMNNN